MGSIRFILDENVPKVIEGLLKRESYPVEYAPKGITNSELAKIVKEKQAILVTRDSDFANTTLYPPRDFFGIIVFMIHPPLPRKLAEAMHFLLNQVKEYRRKLFVVGEEGYKIIE